MEQEIRFCTAADDVRIAYATVGEGPALVKAANWLNHLEFDWQSPIWSHWFTELCRDHRLVRYDERGNGLSDWRVEDLSLEAFVRDLETVVDAAGLERFALLGISQGCAVSIAYTVRHPERVSHLVLYGGYARGWASRGARELERRQALLTLAREGWGQDNPAYRQLFTTLYVPDASREQMDWFNDLQRVSTSAENAVRLMRAFGAIDVRSLLPQVQAPALVLHARDDAVVPFTEGREIAAGVPGARFVALEGRNHILLRHEPAWARFLEETRGFLGVDARPAPALTQVAPRLGEGERLGRYVVVSLLGTGGMGEVYRARDERLGREVAIKVIRAASNDARLRERFEREARAVAALSHPNIVSIYELGSERGLPYAVTELLHGTTLAQRLAEGVLPLAEALDYARQIAAALREAHAARIVHRDLKPDNLFLTHRGPLKVLDFGLALNLPPADTVASGSPPESRLTAPGAVVGSPLYMSPEQLRGAVVDHRTDYFSFGIVLYEMLAGRHPFRGRTSADTITSILRDDPPALALKAPAGVEKLLARCLAKDPAARVQTAAGLEAALGAASAGRRAASLVKGWFRR